MICTRCDGTGFLNLHQIDDANPLEMDTDHIKQWIKDHIDHDVCVCDCCGDGDTWYGNPGEHYTGGDPPGKEGPYAYNGWLPECS